jgi:LysM repeat protein
MNKTQTNHFRMMLNTQGTLDASTTIWNGIPVVLNTKNDLDEIIQRIEETNEKTMPASKAITADKDMVLEGLAQKALVLSGALQAYAAVTGNNVLAEQVKLVKSDLIRARETDVEALVMPVINAARAELANMADYGVTEAMITETETSLDAFKVLIGQPRTIRNQAFAAMDLLDELLDAANVILKNKLDPMMIRFKFTDTEFYSEYERARTIVD